MEGTNRKKSLAELRVKDMEYSALKRTNEERGRELRELENEFQVK